MSNGTAAPLSTGSWVQYNVTTQSPLSPLPSAAEETIGLVRQLFTAQGRQYAQVIWNPGSQFPAVGLYTSDQLTSITQQQAADITNKMNAGTYEPDLGTPSSNYQQPSVPALALPPVLQGTDVTPTLNQPIDQPLSQGTGYQ